MNLHKFSKEFEVIQMLTLDALKIKQRYIESDEFDKGIRNLLNYGHTFGHAFESATSYKIPHGIAVTIGMLAATFISERLGMIDQGYYDHLNEFLKPYYEPYNQELHDDDLEKVIKAIKFDKKNTGKMINCILTRGEGKMEKASLSLDTQLYPLLAEFLSIISSPIN
jgi:3-dehydroquinate synthase